MWTAKLCEITVIKTIDIPFGQETFEYPEVEQLKDLRIHPPAELQSVKRRLFQRMIFRSYNEREATETTHYIYFDVEDMLAKLPIIQEAVNIETAKRTELLQHQIEYLERTNKIFDEELSLSQKHVELLENRLLSNKIKKLWRAVWHW